MIIPLCVTQNDNHDIDSAVKPQYNGRPHRIEWISFHYKAKIFCLLSKDQNVLAFFQIAVLTLLLSRVNLLMRAKCFKYDHRYQQPIVKLNLSSTRS